MSHIELRDPDLAKEFILESLLLARAHPLSADSVKSTLRVAMELTSDGSPLPPLGLVFDISEVATRFGTERKSPPEVHGFHPGLTRRYEDYVLGKMYADISFERGVDAIARFEGRERDRAIAFMINQLCRRCDVVGAYLSPAVIKSFQQLTGDEVVAMAGELITPDGISATMSEHYEKLVTAIQSSGELLGAEDIFELEHGTALAEFGQRIALHQVLRAAAELEKNLPNQKPRSQPRKYSVATNILEEDFYPVGGFSSISNKGTIESLLRSELAYIDDEVRPDLFDIKFARGELLYYSRDENQFLRRRLSFVFLLDPSLAHARFKDPQIEWQRIILLMAMLYAMVERISNWLSVDAMQFEFLFLNRISASPLDDERELLEMLFREQLESGMVTIGEIEESEVVVHCDDLARTSLCHSLMLTSELRSLKTQIAISSQVVLEPILPALYLDEEDRFRSEDESLDGWRESLERLLKFLV